MWQKTNKKYRTKCFLEHRSGLALWEVQGCGAEIFILCSWMFNLFLMPKLHLRILSLTQGIFPLSSYRGDLQDEQTILTYIICPCWHWHMPLSWIKHQFMFVWGLVLVFLWLCASLTFYFHDETCLLTCKWKTVVAKLALSAFLPWKGPASECTFWIIWLFLA